MKKFVRWNGTRVRLRFATVGTQRVLTSRATHLLRRHEISS
jgi:hypothetical protein